MLALFALPSTSASALSTLSIDAETPLPQQVERMALLHDPGRALTLTEVRSPEVARRFALAPPGVPNLGVGRDAVWARFAVHNASAATMALKLVLTDARIGQVGFWALDGAGEVVAERRDGRFADPADRDRSHRWFVFDLRLAPAQTLTVYVRVESNTGRRLDLRLTDRTRLAEVERGDYGLHLLIVGAVSFMLAYNLLLLLQLRDPAYLWLCCVLAGGIVFQLEREGLLTTLFSGFWPERFSGIHVGSALALAGVYLFPVAYLRLRTHAPRWVWLHYLLAALALSGAVLDLFVPHLAYTLISLLGVSCAPAMIASGLLVRRHQPRGAAWYLAAWAPLFLAMLPLLPMNYGLIPASPLSWSLLYIGNLLMLLMLSVAQADRVNTLRRDAERARAALAANEVRLTELVAERTRDLAQALERAETANRAKTRFLANMSHDLRTPLNAVLGFAQLLARSPLGDEQRRQCGLIGRSGRHLLRLIDDLLDVATIEHKRLQPVLGDCALPALLDDLTAVAGRRAAAKGLAFHTEFAPDLPALVRTDERRVRQVLQNLLDNAVKYTDTGWVRFGAAVHTAAGADSPELVLTVADSGRGIAPGERERLFAAFEQDHPSQEAAGSGSPFAASSRRCSAVRWSSTVCPGAAVAFGCACPSWCASRPRSPPQRSPRTVPKRRCCRAAAS